MYSLNMPVARIRSKVREEFEKHRYVNNLKAVDVLISQSHMEFQVCHSTCQPQPHRLRDSASYRRGHWSVRVPALHEQLLICLFSTILGNLEFLETALTRDEVLPQRRGSHRPTAEELHVGIFGGELPAVEPLFPARKHC
jgi:hypothetical protein